MKQSTSTSKFKDFFKKLYQNFVRKEIYTEDKPVPKSYANTKKFYALYIVFLFYSFLLLVAINTLDNESADQTAISFYFIFGNALIGMFLILSLLYSSEKVRTFIFEKHTIVKQAVLYIGLMFISIFIFSYLLLSLQLNLISYLMLLSTIWLILLGVRYYMYSRKFATKIEVKFTKKYSKTRRVIAAIFPFIIIGVLIVISLVYRSLLVFISLDIFGPHAPDEAVQVYDLAMGLVMPLIYFSLIITALFIIFEFVFTRKRAETKRAGLFDNFTFSLIVMFIFFFQLFQMTLFIALRPETVNAISKTFGASGATISFIFIFEFVISMFFLYRITKNLGKSIGWRIFIFKGEGLITLILGCVLSQTLVNFALHTGVSYQSMTEVGRFFMANRYMISIIMIIFLGATLLVYYLKPHETSMFIRLQKETVSEEEKAKITIYNLLKQEYIRRGEAYPIEILERELIKATKLPKKTIHTDINQLAKEKIDLQLSYARDEKGHRMRFVDFLSITEKFDRKDIAEKKAKRFLAEQLYQTTTTKNQKPVRLKYDSNSDKATDIFISSLSNNLAKQQKSKETVERKRENANVSFSQKEVPDILREDIMEIIKMEYAYRVENTDKFEGFQFPISEIAGEIQQETNVNPGQLYPIIEIISKTDVELELLKNSEIPEDKLIRIFPIADDNLNYIIANFRPEEFKRIKKKVTKNFLRTLSHKRSRTAFTILRRKVSGDSENHQTWHRILSIFYEYYPKLEKDVKSIQDYQKLKNIVSVFPIKQISEQISS